MKKTIYAYIDWCEMDGPIFIGTLQSDVVRTKEVFSFNADPSFINHKEFRLLDPDLGQFSGPQYLRDEKVNFGLFLDSSPDRWGRLLIKRRETIRAKEEDRKAKPLFESDFLLGVYDQSRMGALRFKLDPSGDFLDNEDEMTTPPWTSLRELEYASLQYEKEALNPNGQYAKWLKMIFAPGSSLGGARPKANIKDENGQLWIAKFPSKTDTFDVGAWERLANILAKNCGINTPESRIAKYSSSYNTFLCKRFDRRPDGGRAYFASAMTLLGYTDGSNASDGVSYLELAEFITQHGANVNANLEQLWRRIVLNIAISNCDDHLRNHGFILTRNGWELSPVYDINPDDSGMGLKLNIDEADNSLDFDLALSVADYFRLPSPDAKTTLNQIRENVSKWRTIATGLGISRSEQEMMENAFRY